MRNMPRQVVRAEEPANRPKRRAKRSTVAATQKPKTNPRKVNNAIRPTEVQAVGRMEFDATAPLERTPTVDELKSVDLAAKFPPGHVPAIVTYGRRLQVMSLMLAGEPTFNIIEYCGRAFGMSESLTKNMVTQIRSAWRRDMEEQSAFARSETVMRLRRDLSTMRNSPTKDWAAIRQHEVLLSRIEGTEAPVKVVSYDGNAVMRQALGSVLGGFDDRMLVEYNADGEEAAEAAE